MLIKNPLFYLVLILALLAGMLAVNFVKATYTGPAETFPEGIPESPLDLSSDSQTKEGGLTVSGLVITPSTETTPLYLDEDGICMNESASGAMACKSYWDQVTNWSDVSAGGGIYYNGTGNIGIGTNNLSSGAILNVKGLLNMNNNKIINTTSTEYADAATRGYVNFKDEETIISGRIYGTSDVDISAVTGEEWDICFLTEFGRESRGFKRVKEAKCWVEGGGSGVISKGDFIEKGEFVVENYGETSMIKEVRAAPIVPPDDGGGGTGGGTGGTADTSWKLIVEADGNGRTTCAARCIKFGKTSSAASVGGTTSNIPPAVPGRPANFEAVYDAAAGELSLNWDNVIGEERYEIEHSDVAPIIKPDKNNNWAWLMPSTAYALEQVDSWTSLVSLNADTTSYSVAKSEVYGTYWYSIRACNDGGCSSWVMTEAKVINKDTGGNGGNGGSGSPSGGGPEKPKQIPQ